jgi:mRNA-degrading endonuclease RelE of RelBE toxin-antitoxin system
MYALEVRAHVDKTLKRLARRSPGLVRAIEKKVGEILEDPHRFKPMHFPLAGMRRVHFGSYVLIFSIDEQRRAVVLEDFEHHDMVFKGRQ